VGLSAVLNELASHPCAVVIPSVRECIPPILALTIVTRLAKPELKGRMLNIRLGGSS
jgi:hypothetical protein